MSADREREKDDWHPMDTAPLETPVMVRMETDRVAGGVWVATALIYERDDDSRIQGDVILHYNGDALVTRFRGPLTGWRPLPAALSRPTTKATGDEG